jgi:hypothetical protein
MANDVVGPLGKRKSLARMSARSFGVVGRRNAESRSTASTPHSGRFIEPRVAPSDVQTLTNLVLEQLWLSNDSNVVYTREKAFLERLHAYI